MCAVLIFLCSVSVCVRLVGGWLCSVSVCVARLASLGSRGVRTCCSDLCALSLYMYWGRCCWAPVLCLRLQKKSIVSTSPSESAPFILVCVFVFMVVIVLVFAFVSMFAFVNPFVSRVRFHALFPIRVCIRVFLHVRMRVRVRLRVRMHFVVFSFQLIEKCQNAQYNNLSAPLLANMSKNKFEPAWTRFSGGASRRSFVGFYSVVQTVFGQCLTRLLATCLTICLRGF